MKNHSRIGLRVAAAAGMMALARSGLAATIYVWTNSAANGPGTAWTNAYRDIQSAASVAVSNDVILVTNGVYAVGGRVTPGGSLTNRVCLTNAVTVRSVNGPAVTIIAGAADPVSTNGPAAVRCVYLTGGAYLVGFTLTNGHTGVSGWPTNNAGGGVLLLNGGTVSNCVLAGNQAFQDGGGAALWAGGAVWNSRIQGNGVVTNNGGGAYLRSGGTLRNCLIAWNDAVSAGTQGYGGGVCFSQSGGLAENCTIVSNRAKSGGGVYCDQGGTNRNNIIHNNSATGPGTNWAFATAGRFEYCCTTPLTGIPGGTGCISNNPAFLDPSGDFHPAATSACVNAGTNLPWTAGAGDLDGRCRWVGTNVDIGCYERMQSAGAGSPAHYVSLVGSNRWPFTNAATAARLIQDAVDTASDGDTVFVTNGTYVLTDQISVTNGLRVKGITWPTPTIVNGNRSSRCFRLSHSNAIVDSVTITNGFASYGGGVFIATYGTVVNSTIAGNRAAGGGGVWCDYGGLVTNCNIIGNAATDEGLQDGGGGVFLNWGGRLAYCTIAGNSATNLGGGVHCYFEGASPVSVENCTIRSNRAWHGGGAFCDSGGTIRNSLVVGNVADEGSGGGIYLYYGGTVQNCTVCDNTSALPGGGIRSLPPGLVYNCIAYFNGAGGDIAADSGSDIDWSCASSTNGISGWDHGATNNPAFADRANGNYRLRWWSPCIDSGTDLTAQGVTNDFAGARRPLDGNADGMTNFDMGAYEFNVQTEAPPFVAITNADAVVDYGVTSVTLAGTNNDNVVGLLTWSNVLTGAVGTAPSALAWTLVVTGLECRDNVIVVRGTNVAGLVASDTTRVARVVASDPGNSPAHYVATNGAGLWPFTNWTTAARCVQAAVDAAAAGDTVWVSNGVYAVGGAFTPGYSLMNRVVITNGITVQSVNGTSNTVLMGQGPVGDSAMRCVCLSNGVVSGFTLTNGHTLAGSIVADTCGGGAYGGGVLTNCIVTGNRSGRSISGGGGGGAYGTTLLDCVIAGNDCMRGGGIYGGEASRCRIAGNEATSDGGGAAYARLNNCTISSNSAGSGGGAYNCDLLGCIVSDNSGLQPATISAGGTYGGTLTNCIVARNTTAGYGAGVVYAISVANCTVVSNSAPNGWYGGTYISPVYNSIVYYNFAVGVSNMYDAGTNCCTYPNPGGSGNVTNAPQFVDLAGGDYHLKATSPCINKGSNVYATVATDLDGAPRILGGRVDIGGYEYFALTNTMMAPAITSPCAVAAGSTATFMVTNWGGPVTIAGAKATNTWTVNPWATNGIAQAAAGAVWTNAGQSLARSPAGATNTWTYRALSTNLLTFSGSNTTLVIVNYLVAPQIAIANPDALLSYETTSVTVSGTQAGAVGQMRWTNALTGAGGAFAATNPWAIGGIALTVGVNVIAVSATNVLGDVGSNRVSLTRTAYSPVHYAALAGGGVYPFTNWAAAATNIQTAVDASGAGDTVLVGDGTYGLASQISITNAVTVRSLNGAAVTIVNGNYPAYTNRCFYVGSSNVLIDGFTITNGCATPGSGGGVWLAASSAVQRCVIAGNRAGNGGGVYGGAGGRLGNCVVAGNTATNTGGGLRYDNAGCAAFNCLIQGNSAAGYGGGVYLYNTGDQDAIMNCTIVSNSAGVGAGGAAGEVFAYVNSAIVYFNAPDNWQGIGDPNALAFFYCCTWPTSSPLCVTNDPQFLDRAGANYRLRFGSPCIDGGLYLSAQGITNDLDGVARPIDGNFDGAGAYDMGCYEYNPDTTDSDNDGMTDSAEWIAVTDPTNAASYFRVAAISNLPPFRVYFPSSTGRVYALQGCTNLLPSNPWFVVGGESNKTGNGGTFWLTDTNAAATNRFYRLSVQMPP